MHATTSVVSSLARFCRRPGWRWSQASIEDFGSDISGGSAPARASAHDESQAGPTRWGGPTPNTTSNASLTEGHPEIVRHDEDEENAEDIKAHEP